MVVAGAAVIGVARAQAVSLSVNAPVQVAAGWMRAAGHYNSGTAEPTFQVVARCGIGSSDVRVLYGMQVVPAESALWLDLPGTPDRLGPADLPCETPEVSLEMLVDTKVVARAAFPRRERGSASRPTAANEQAASLPEPQRRLQLDEQKYERPGGGRTESGVALSLGTHASIQLNLTRTAQPPMMGHADDNGVLARLRIGF